MYDYQGQTFIGKTGLYLSSPVFSHGQLYVALSRVTKYCDIKVLVVDGKKKGQSNFTENIVYKDVFG